MHKLEANAANDFPSIWSSFLTFETVSRGRDERLDAFISRWEEKMGLAQSAGCDYSDIVLACKLLQKANLDENEVKEIVNSIAFGNSEMLGTLLCILADYPVEKSKRGRDYSANKELENGHSEPIKEELSEELRYNSSTDTFLKEEELIPEIKIEVKDESSEVVQHVISTRLLDEENDITLGSYMSVEKENETVQEIADDEENSERISCATKRMRPSVILRRGGRSGLTGKAGARTSGNRHYCNDCPKFFKESSTLKHHIMRVHTNERPFHCPHCDYTAVDKFNLNRHLFSHTGQRPFKCTLCEKSFPVRNTLKKHIKQVHTDERPFKCPQCDYRSLDKSTLNRHMRSHTGERPFKCNQCDKGYTENKDLKRHIMRVHTNESPHQCPHCSYSTVYKNYLMIHIRGHTGEQPFKCAICEKAFADKDHMKRHMKGVHKNNEQLAPEDDKDGEKIESENDNQHEKQSQEEVPLHLPEGSVIRMNPQNENGSSYAQDQDLKSQCELCGKKVLKKLMKKHHEQCLNRSQGNQPTKKREERKKGERLQCEHCGKDFSGQGSLKVHYGICPNLNPEERDAKGYKVVRQKNQFTCEVCNKTLFGQSTFENHMSLHSGKRNFKCEVCPRTFTSSHYLDLHKYRHEKGKCHHCHLCPRSFHGTSDLKQHIMREHTNERPFQCPHCSYCTVSSSHLNRHVRSHTGETPFKCNLCGKLYRDRKSVKRHLNAHHGFFDVKYIGRNPVNKPEEEKFVET